MDKDINDYKYGDLLDDIKLKSFIQHSTPAEIDISACVGRCSIKVKTCLTSHFNGSACDSDIAV